ncbi:hypothetical protein COT49_02930 [candidate division WWE3 bacterium CG08_land_8_20_14_0_20_40_13]|uniref:DUF5683 domain-containing protein n=1 Tax=candidate division WWE3 bacterium CG08_land_8_20_14_0_20_40_13 TaxID=1975084 RepID=A0A2H0XDG4_UNCKA|nr:MAG: hypothetical protein COT49_02930 [candidate division WWE3 bacterium CG08_land_8_20_14_0_20_40_13]
MELQLLSTSLKKQIFMYLISFLLPPFGLGWAFKYIKNGDQKAKKIGWVIVAVTVISLAVNIVLFKSAMAEFYSVISNNSQMYRDLGY